jgi:histidyl-tRNA synthetase
MDYYNLTVFEFVTTSLGAQGTVCAGGRYDDLITQIGGKPAPAVGWAMGVERVLELMREQGRLGVAQSLDVYAIVPGSNVWSVVLPTLQKLRVLGVSVQMHTNGPQGMGSMKSQFKRANASGARFALIFGDDELAEDSVTVKPLRDPSSEQTKWSLASLETWAGSLQSKA